MKPVNAVNTLRSPFTDEPIEHGGLYLTPNHQGSTTMLTDSSGNLAEQYFYLPFGQTWQSAGTSNPFEFTGRENDGTGLYWYRSRYYAPDLGRFLSEDIGGPRGRNRYEYAGGDPANGVDPSGKDWLIVQSNPGGIAGTGGHASIYLASDNAAYNGTWYGYYPYGPGGRSSSGSGSTKGSTSPAFTGPGYINIGDKPSPRDWRPTSHTGWIYITAQQARIIRRGIFLGARGRTYNAATHNCAIWAADALRPAFPSNDTIQDEILTPLDLYKAVSALGRETYPATSPTLRLVPGGE